MTNDKREKKEQATANHKISKMIFYSQWASQ